MRNRILFSFLAWVAVIVSVQGKQKDFVLQSGRPVAIACSGSEAPVVRTSLDLLSRDLQTVLSATAHIDTNTGNILVGTIGQSKLIEQAGIDISALKNKKQAFMLAVSEDGKLVVAGSDRNIPSARCFPLGMVGGCDSGEERDVPPFFQFQRVAVSFCGVSGHLY